MTPANLDTVNRTLAATVVKLQADLAAVDRHNRELSALVLALLENDPNAIAADGGVTVLAVWRKKAAEVMRGAGEPVRVAYMLEHKTYWKKS